MAASKQVDFDTGTPVTADFLDRIQEIQSGLSTNLSLVLSSSTTVTIPASAGNGVVSLTIGDKFRYIEAPAVVTFSGSDASGSYGIWATTTSDDSVSSFSVVKESGSGSPSATYYRQIGSVSWDGSALTALSQTAGYADHGYMHTLAGDPLPAASVSASQIVDGTITLAEIASSLAAYLVPIASVLAYGGASAPSGFLLCDGGEYSRTTYSALDAQIGTAFGDYTDGSGNAGSSHFRVPDLRGRVVAGVDNMGGTTASRLSASGLLNSVTATVLGHAGGSETVQLLSTQSGLPSHTVNADGGHTHTVSTNGSHSHGGATGGAGSHAHTYSASYDQNWNIGGGGGISLNKGTFAAGTSAVGDHAHGIGSDGNHSHTVNGGSHTHSVTAANAASAHTNTQPTMLLNYIIKH